MKKALAIIICAAAFVFMQPELGPLTFWNPNTATVMVRADARGSGVAITPHHVLTAQHVVKNDKSVRIKDSSGNTQDGTVMVRGWNDAADLAVVYVEEPLPDTAPLSCAPPKHDERVVVAGHPMSARNTYTRGRVVSLEIQGHEWYTGVDAVAGPGNSGGPVYDMYGNVVGILVAGLVSQRFGSIGLNLMISGEDLCKALARY